jgi:SAM-dependent methyltransferase
MARKLLRVFVAVLAGVAAGGMQEGHGRMSGQISTATASAAPFVAQDDGGVWREFQDPSLPLIDTEAVPACSVCRSEQSVPFASGFDYELKTCRNKWQFVKCGCCGHVWLNPRPAISALPIIYPRSYYAYTYDSEVNGIARKAKAILDHRKLQGIIGSVMGRVESFVDVGCGDGRFLKAMETRGLDKSQIYGLELDAAVVEKLQTQGYRAFCKRVEDCTEIPENSADLVTMFHVIEHVDRPELVIRQIARWLKKGGVLALETPNLDSFDARLFGRTFWGGYHIPRHWHLFYPQTLARLLSDNGLTPIGTQFQTGHSFWMYSFHHALRYAKNWPGLARVFNPFKSVLPLALFTAFDKARGVVGQKTSAMLMLARKN